MNDELGVSFEFGVTDGLISHVTGPWPAAGDAEIVLRGDLPPHRAAENVPERIRAEAERRGLIVCHYDPVHCHTCYCDEKGKTIRCVRHC